MPHIIVWGLLPEEIAGSSGEPGKIGKLEKIEEAITQAVLSIPELELKKSDISYSFPEDSSVKAHYPVVIIVELLFEKPKRTQEIRQLLAERVATSFKEAVVWRNLTKVEVAVKRFDVVSSLSGFNPKKDSFFSV
jgi:hypothetical protein